MEVSSPLACKLTMASGGDGMEGSIGKTESSCDWRFDLISKRNTKAEVGYKDSTWVPAMLL